MNCLHNGYFEMRVVIAAEYVQHAAEQAAREGSFDAADYIQGLLNMALISDIDRVELERERKLASPAPREFDDDGGDVPF